MNPMGIVTPMMIIAGICLVLSCFMEPIFAIGLTILIVYLIIKIV